MRILGIDPGYALVGMGAIEYTGNKYSTIKYGKIETFPSMRMNERLAVIFNEMNYWLNQVKPDVVAIEKLFFNTNATTAIGVAQARGVILLACEIMHIKVYEYTPLQVKQAVVGYGKAQKMQVQKMTKTLLNLKEIPKPDDTADALAIAICHTNNTGYNNIMDKFGNNL